MKLNTLSRLTALLMALMMTVLSVAVAETTGMDQTSDDYDLLLAGGECSDTNENCTVLTTLKGYTPAERYDYLCNLFNSSEEGASRVAGVLLHHYFLHYKEGKDTDLLCMCNMLDTPAEFDVIPLYPYQDSRHNIDCPWCGAAEVVTGIVPGATDAAGNVTSYNLILLDVDGNPVTVAKSTMLDGKYHYFQDITTNLYVAYLHTDESGAQWIIPLESKY